MVARTDHAAGDIMDAEEWNGLAGQVNGAVTRVGLIPADVQNALANNANVVAAADDAAATAAAQRIATEKLLYADGLLPHRMRGDGTTEPGAFLAWTADDGYNTFQDYFALLNTKGLKGTLFLTTTWVDKAGINATWNDAYITTAQVQAIVAAGHELATHGVQHEGYASYLAANGAAALHALINGARTTLQTNFGAVVTTGAYPGGESDRRTREVIGRSHEFYRGTKGVLARGAADPYDVPAVDVQALTEAAMKALVDTARADGQLLVFLVHGGLTAANLTKFGNVMDYATAQGVQQGTFYQGVKERTVLRSAGMSIDARGEAFHTRVRTHVLELVREDNLADFTTLGMDEVTNTPFMDSAAALELRAGLLLPDNLATLRVGRRNKLQATLTLGSTQATFPQGGLVASRDNGITITGAGIVAGTTLVVVNATTATLSLAATATTPAGTVTIVTVGRALRPSAEFAGDSLFYGQARLFGEGSPSLSFSLLDGTDQGSVGAVAWRRTGAGGPMEWDTGTGGSSATIKAFDLKLTDHTGARYIALRSGQPADATIANGELVLYVDKATAELRYRAKTAAGVVVQRTITAA